MQQGFYVGDVRFDPSSGTIEGPRGRVHLQPESMEVLLHMASSPGEIVERAYLMDEVWRDKTVTDETLSRCVEDLQKALGESHADPRFIETIPQRGYRLLVTPSTVAPVQPGPAKAVSAGKLEGFFRALRDRKVFRAAVYYGVTSFSIIEIVGEIGGPLGFPDWTHRFIIIGLAAGFPIALLLAWLYDIRRTHGSGRWVDAALFAVTVVAVAVLLIVVDPLPPSPPSPADSIAVMPFVDLSPDGEEDHFGKGMAEEIIHRLTQLRTLRVASRTDTFRLPPDTGIDTIAAEIGVDHVLEGSVRRDGERLRITAQLIDANTRHHLWSENYDRAYADVLTLQTEIAQNVVRTLNLVISAGKEPDAPENLVAYENYLKGRASLHNRETDESLVTAEQLFEAAITADPGYAAAYAGLCETHLWNYQITRSRVYFDQAKDACNEAMGLGLKSAYVHVALANLFRVSGEYRHAHRQFDKAIDADPFDVEAYVGKARTFASQNKFEKAEETLERTLEIQPRYWRGHLQMGNFLFERGRYEEAIPYFRRVTQQQPNDPVAFNNLGSAYFMASDFDAASDAWLKSLELAPTRSAYSNVGSGLYYARRFAEAAPAYEAAIAEAPDDYESYGNLAFVQLHLGAIEQARETFKRAATLAEVARDVNPSDAVATSALAVFYSALGMRDRANELLDEAVRLAPRDMYTFYEAARAHVLLDDPEAALEALRRAVELGYPAVLIAPDAVFDSLRQMPELVSIETNAT